MIPAPRNATLLAALSQQAQESWIIASVDRSILDKLLGDGATKQGSEWAATVENLVCRGSVMPSPFPGMNPYLEQPAVWQDFHQSLVTHIRETLTGQVRPQFSVKIEESVFIHEPSSEERRRRLARPDVAVFENPGRGTVAEADAPASSVAALIASLPDIEIEKHSFIEIETVTAAIWSP